MIQRSNNLDIRVLNVNEQMRVKIMDLIKELREKAFENQEGVAFMKRNLQKDFGIKWQVVLASDFKLSVDIDPEMFPYRVQVRIDNKIFVVFSRGIAKNRIEKTPSVLDKSSDSVPYFAKESKAKQSFK